MHIEIGHIVDQVAVAVNAETGKEILRVVVYMAEIHAEFEVVFAAGPVHCIGDLSAGFIREL